MIELANFDFPERCLGLECPELQNTVLAENSFASLLAKRRQDLFAGKEAHEVAEVEEEQEIRGMLFITQLIAKCREENLDHNGVCGTIPQNMLPGGGQ